MYLHFRDGFVEADRWDGKFTGIPEHDDALRAVFKRSQIVIVVRSRSAETLQRMTSLHLRRWNHTVETLASRPTWDYPHRFYVTQAQWSQMLGDVAFTLDYRNFKHTEADRHGANSHEAHMALDVWRAAAPKSKGGNR